MRKEVLDKLVKEDKATYDRWLSDEKKKRAR